MGIGMLKISSVCFNFSTAINKAIRSIKCHVAKTCNPNIHTSTLEMALQRVEALTLSAAEQFTLKLWNIDEVCRILNV